MIDSSRTSGDESDSLGGLARRVDEHGKRAWRQGGSQLAEGGRRFGYVVAITVNAMLFYVFHQLVAWNVPFITEAWPSVLWAVDLSLVAGVVVNALYLGYDARWFRHVGAVVSSAFSFLSLYTMWKVYPFDFGAYDQMVQFAMAVGLVGIVIAIVVESIQLIAGAAGDR